MAIEIFHMGKTLSTIAIKITDRGTVNSLLLINLHKGNKIMISYYIDYIDDQHEHIWYYESSQSCSRK